jgi:rubrerythrin
MPKFESPFSGLANDRKLMDEELIRAIRFAIAVEFEATQLYMQLAESTDNKLAIAVLNVAVAQPGLKSSLAARNSNS